MKPKKTRATERWTEARFFSFIRSALRRASTRWPPIYDCKLENRRASKSDNPRLKWEYQCIECLRWLPDKLVHVDHIIPAGSLKQLTDLTEFVEKLFCEKNGLCILCKECHHKKTQKEKQQTLLKNKRTKKIASHP